MESVGKTLKKGICYGLFYQKRWTEGHTKAEVNANTGKDAICTILTALFNRNKLTQL